MMLYIDQSYNEHDALTNRNSKEEKIKYSGITSKIGEYTVIDPFGKVTMGNEHSSPNPEVTE